MLPIGLRLDEALEVEGSYGPGYALGLYSSGYGISFR